VGGGDQPGVSEYHRITEFLTKEPVETLAPIRRAARQTP